MNVRVEEWGDVGKTKQKYKLGVADCALNAALLRSFLYTVLWHTISDPQLIFEFWNGLLFFPGWESAPRPEPEVRRGRGQDGQRDTGPLAAALLCQRPPTVVLWGEDVKGQTKSTCGSDSCSSWSQYPEEDCEWIELVLDYFSPLKRAQMRTPLCAPSWVQPVQVVIVHQLDQEETVLTSSLKHTLNARNVQHPEDWMDMIW